LVVGIGELANFLINAAFVMTAGVIYRFNRTRKGALAGSFAGAVAASVISVPVNYFIVYPFYTAFMPMEAILGMYRAINPAVENLWDALLWFNMPFTFIKGMCSVAMAFVIYKPLSPILKGLGRR
jgi:riboflavin transporter FmnP